MTDTNITINPGAAVRVTEVSPRENDDRVSLAPLNPETALRALLATQPADQD